MKTIYIIVTCFILSFTRCAGDPLAKLPSFSFRLPDSTTIYSTAKIPKGYPIVLIRFDAYCKDCQEETDSLLMNMEAMKEIHFYFITTEPFSQVKEFNEFYELSKYPNIIVGHDFEKFFPKHFKSHSTPFIAMYDKRQNLVGIYDGKPPMSDLLSSIQSIK